MSGRAGGASGPDDLVGETVAAHEAVRVARAEYQRLAHERDQLVRRTLDAGVGAASLSQAMGLSRQRVYKMAETKW